MSTIKKYCITNGTVDKVQQDLYEGGSVPGKADIAYAVKEANDIMQRGHMGEYRAFGYAPSYTGFFYDSLYCFGKTMFQNASGREISCGQTLFCAWEDLIDGDIFRQEVLLFPFLSLEELLESASYKKQQIFNREPRKPQSGVSFSETQKKNIARTVYKLMMDKNVALQLPNVPNYEAYSLAVLQEVFRTVPKRDRREISFSTARSPSDINQIKGRIRLILTGESSYKNSEYEWIHLDEETPFTEEERIIDRWQREEEQVREDVEKGYFFAEEKHRNLKKDYASLEKLYNRTSYWWKEPQIDRKMKTFEEIMAEYRANPTLSIQSNRKLFFGKLRLFLAEGAGDESPFERSLTGVLLDYLFQRKIDVKGKQLSLFENDSALNAFLKTCESDFYWFGMDQQWVDAFSEEVGLLKEMLRHGATA